jgi:ABC-type multidrug transport system fused ATPase/permease subunit
MRRNEETENRIEKEIQMNNDQDISKMSELYAIARFERMKRLRFVLAVVPGIVALIMVSTPTRVWQELFPNGMMDTRLSLFVPIISLSLFAMSILGIIMIYLQTGFKRDFREKEQLLDYELEFKNLRKQMASSKNILTSNKLLILQDQLESMQREIQLKFGSKQNIQETQQLVNKIFDRMKTEASEKLLSELEVKVQERVNQKNVTQAIDSHYELSLQRLKNEMVALSWKGDLNLGLGIVITVIGFFLLGFFLFKTDATSEQFTSFALHFIPRLSLVIFVEMFAYFFLALYKSTLSEIKYFQNELTNIESKYCALRIAIQVPCNNALEKVIDQFACTERNHILKKGETTVLLEQHKLNRDTIKEIAKGLPEVITSVVKK